MIECVYLKNDKCKTGKRENFKCRVCVNNTKRHYIEDYFEKANDNPIPDKCPVLTYSGPIEQTAGYKCPVCGKYTKPYQLKDNVCASCGYLLNVK